MRLIASENYASRAVMEATGSIFTNKYSEGYAHKRYYEGQQAVDKVEELAIARLKGLFGAEHVNVQPYSGSPANLAVYFAFCSPGDTVMGLALPAGGHLTHGHNVSITGKYFKSVQYGVRKRRPPHRHGPGARPGARAPAQAPLVRDDRVPADARFPGLPGHRRRGGRAARGRHRAHRGARLRRRAPVARSGSPTS